MITDARWQDDLIAALQLESLFKSGNLGGVVHRARRAPHRQCVFQAADRRAKANVATWRTYLPEDCVVAMIEDGWDRST